MHTALFRYIEHYYLGTNIIVKMIAFSFSVNHLYFFSCILVSLALPLNETILKFVLFYVQISLNSTYWWSILKCHLSKLHTYIYIYHAIQIVNDYENIFFVFQPIFRTTMYYMDSLNLTVVDHIHLAKSKLYIFFPIKSK